MDDPTIGTLVSLVTEAKASDARLAGVLFVATGILMLLLVPVFEALFPGFTFRNALSDLEAAGAPNGLYVTGANLVRDLGFLAGTYLLFRGTGQRRTVVLFLLPALGSLLPTLFPENVNVVVHSIGAVIFFVSAPLLEILSYRFIRTPFRYVAVVLGALTAVMGAVLFAGWATVVPSTLGTAGFETMILYPYYIWSIGFGSLLMTLGWRNADTR